MDTSSTMLELGTPFPHFELPDFNGTPFDSAGVQAPGILVIFLCPHCPFVRHIRRALARMTREYQAKGLAIVGINSNDIDQYPMDGPEGMKQEAEDAGYVFPYLLDRDQSVARLYRAACTPDFFLFDHDGNLAYRGQFDGSRPRNNVPVTGADLRAAADAVLGGRSPSADQRASMGCNIKWKPGNEPEYFAPRSF
ncbi:MAG TPA: thioredoxin family protein [Terriglobia bacterium]|nr:thioredoxin family protein [Terriglobia bacterium]